MGKLQAFLALGRPFTSLLGAVAIFAATFVGAGTNIGTYWIPVLVATVLGYIFISASNTLNDYFDRDIDRINHPERPIPSGKVSANAAMLSAVLQFAVSLSLGVVLIWFVGFQAFVVVVAALLVELAYDFWVKQKAKVFGNIFIGFQTVLAFLFGGIIVNNISPVLFMAAASFLSITAREVVKDVEDLKGDSNKRSLPKILGVNKANAIAIALLLAAIILSILAYWPLHLLGVGYLVVVLVADAVFVGSMPLLFKNPNKARHIWKYAMMIALLAFIVGAII